MNINRVRRVISAASINLTNCRSSLRSLLVCLFVVFTLGVTPGQAQSCQSCVLVTDPQASQAFSAGNGAAVNLNNCGLYVDSNSSTAMSVTGGAAVNASSIQVVGGYSINNGGSATPTPVTGAPTTADPFATVPAPSIGTCLSHPDYTQWGQTGSYELYPGTYCGGLTISNGVTAHFNPGVYVINGGGIAIRSGWIHRIAR